MECPHCHALISHSLKRDLNGAGRWLHETSSGGVAPIESGDVRRTDLLTYWLDGAAAAFASWSDLVIQYRQALTRFEATGDEEALTAMAEASGTDLEGYKAQLAATEMFYDPADAVAQASSADLPTTMTNVAEFLFDKGILGEGAPSADFVGVAYPDGSTSGDANNVKFRYDATYMQMAADGEL